LNFKVFIPTSGTGARLKEKTFFFNKSLMEVNFKPLISHIIEKFHKKQNFLISLGYLGDQVKQYLEIAHPETNFEYVKINKFEGPKSGLGLSILKCKKKLQSPFIFISCDSYLKGPLNLKINQNWLGFSKNVKNFENYRLIKITKNKSIEKLLEKGHDKQKNIFKYIGVAGIKDYKIFWKNMKNVPDCVAEGEAFAIKRMLYKNKFYGKEFKWSDGGSLNDLIQLQKKEKKEDINILPKVNEALWVVNGNIIKFSNDKSFIKQRVQRQKILKRYTPKITSYSDNFYVYKKIEGKIFSKVASISKFDNLLIYLKKFWLHENLNQKNKIRFYKICRQFYKKKTEKRIIEFYDKFKVKDKSEFINNKYRPKLKQILNQIDWETISRGVPVNFHGDLHFENILMSNQNFFLLDWRQNFGGIINYGDIYYDLAKLYHGLIVPHSSIVKNRFNIKIKNSKIFLDIKKKLIYNKLLNNLDKWIIKNGYDLQKVKIMTGLIFLNIAALHHDPYSKFLYYLGKDLIYREVNEKS
jgi:NDP-sugar pyrophosphorylase family protein